MKVLIVVSTLSFGGAERAAANVSRILANRHEVSVLAFHGHISYPYAGQLFDLAMPYEPDAGFARKVQKLYLKYTGYRQVVRQVQPDVVLSFTEGPNIVALLNKQAGLRSRVVTNTQGPPSQHYKGVYSPVYAAMIRRLYRQADSVVALSEGVMTELATQFHVPPAKIQVIYNPMDLAQISTLSVLPVNGIWPDDTVPVVLSVGRLVPQKNPLLLLRAFASVLDRLDARLAFIGQGPLEYDLRQLARRLHVEDKIVFLGWQDNPFKYMSRASVFALSSDYEGFGNVLVEAMACGSPVVSTNCSFGPSEILEDGRHGLLVPVRDEQALAETLCQVLSNAKLRESLSKRGRARAEAFRINVIGDQYLRLIEAVGGSE